MFHSLHSRLWLVNILLVGSVLCIVVFGVTVYVVRNPAALRQAVTHLDVATNVVLRASQWNDINDQTQFQQLLETADKNLSARFILISPEGKSIADSRLDEAPIPVIAVNRILHDSLLRNYLQFRDQNKKIWIYTNRILPNGMTLITSNPKPGIERDGQTLLESESRTFRKKRRVPVLGNVVKNDRSLETKDGN